MTLLLLLLVFWLYHFFIPVWTGLNWFELVSIKNGKAKTPEKIKY